MTDEQPDRHRRRVILACCSLSMFIVSLDATIVNVGLPSIQRDLHTDVAGLQWVFDAYLLVLASLLLLSGSLGDRFGRRRMFRIGLVTFGVGSLLCSLAPNIELLVASRMLQAAGGSMLNPNTLSIISNVFTDSRERAQAIGIWGSVFGVSAASGPILGGVLVEAVGWRSLFWINLPVVVTALVLATRFVPESRAERPRRLDPPGQALAIILLASLSYAIIEGPTRGWTSPLILALFAVAAAALPTLLVVERHRVQPLLEMRFFRSPPFSGAACIATLAFMVLTGFLFLNTLYLQEARGDSALVAGISTLPVTLVVVVVSPISGRITGRRGSRGPLTVAGIVMAGGSLVLAQVHSDSPFLMLAVAYLLLGLGFGLVNPPITNTAMAGMPRAQSGVAAAIASTSRQVGSALGVALVGSLATVGFHRQLTSSLTRLGAPPAQRAALLHAGIGSGGVDLAHAGPAVSGAVSDALSVASHAGWYLTAGCSVAVALVALATTGPRARATAEAVLAEI